MEDVRSLGHRTSLSLLEQAGSTVVDRGDHVLVSTASNPDFWWGNFLLIHERPSADQALEWVARFEQELPWARHRAFGLDDPQAPGGAFSAFGHLGYTVERSTVMTAGSLPSTNRSAPDGTVHLLSGDDDWDQHLALSLQVYPEPEGSDATAFARRRAVARRRVVETGAGVWVGAFIDGRLVSQLGILRAGQGLARYQDVETHPDFRRLGSGGGEARVRVLLPGTDAITVGAPPVYAPPGPMLFMPSPEGSALAVSAALERAPELGCAGVVVNQTAGDHDMVGILRAAGLRSHCDYFTGTIESA